MGTILPGRTPWSGLSHWQQRSHSPDMAGCCRQAAQDQPGSAISHQQDQQGYSFEKLLRAAEDLNLLLSSKFKPSGARHQRHSHSAIPRSDSVKTLLTRCQKRGQDQHQQLWALHPQRGTQMVSSAAFCPTLRQHRGSLTACASRLSPAEPADGGDGVPGTASGQHIASQPGMYLSGASPRPADRP